MGSFDNMLNRVIRWLDGEPEVKKEKLTDERACEILGNYAPYVVMYNFDNHKWNRSFYLGHRIMSMGVDCYNMRANFQERYPDLELVAVVGMAIKEPPLKTHVYLPKPAGVHDKQPFAYATFIVRDRKNGKLKELPQKWIMLSECANQTFVCEAMPQLLSGIGFSSARNIDIDWCLDGHKITDSLVPEKEIERVRAQTYKKLMHRFRKR